MSLSKLGVFGGTFNPPHLGHLNAAKECRELLDLDQVWLVPTNKTPGKDDGELRAGELRKKLIELSLEGYEGVRCSDVELTRDPPSYTFDTLTEISSRHGLNPQQIYFILGLDSWLGIEKWSRFPELLNLANFVVISRPNTDSLSKIELIAGRSPLCYNGGIENISFKELSNQEITYETEDKSKKASPSSQFNQARNSALSAHPTASDLSERHTAPGGNLPRMVGKWRNASGMQILAVQVTPHNISSAQIRKLAADGRSISGLVADSVVSIVLEEYKKI